MLYEYYPRPEIPNMSGNTNTNLPINFMKILEHANPELFAHFGDLNERFAADSIGTSDAPAQCTQHSSSEGFDPQGRDPIFIGKIHGKTAEIYELDEPLAASVVWVRPDELLLTPGLEGSQAVSTNNGTVTYFVNFFSEGVEFEPVSYMFVTRDPETGEVVSAYPYANSTYTATPPHKQIDKMFARFVTLYKTEQWSGYGSWDKYLQSFKEFNLFAETSHWPVRRR